MILSHTGGGNWEYTEIKRVWSSISYSPVVKIRTIVNVPVATTVEIRPEFDFVEGANEFYPYQLEFISPNKSFGNAEMYNLEAFKLIDVSSIGIKDIWDVRCQGAFLRVGMKSTAPCEVDFQTLFQADI